MDPRGGGHWFCCGLTADRSELGILSFFRVLQNNEVQPVLARKRRGDVGEEGCAERG